MAEQTTQAPPQTATFCWNELMTRNLPAAKTFYTKLFGWTTEEKDLGKAGNYTIWKKGPKQAGGGDPRRGMRQEPPAAESTVKTGKGTRHPFNRRFSHG